MLDLLRDAIYLREGDLAVTEGEEPHHIEHTFATQPRRQDFFP
jgi:hypothetical protein